LQLIESVSNSPARLVRMQLSRLLPGIMIYNADLAISACAVLLIILDFIRESVVALRVEKKPLMDQLTRLPDLQQHRRCFLDN
jgi:hypothetical protein